MSLFMPGPTSLDPTRSTRRWGRIHLNNDDSLALAWHASHSESDPYDDIEGVRQDAGAAWLDLSGSTRSRILDLASGASRRPELYITGLPEPDDLPPTPVVDTRQRSSSGRLSEFLMMTVCSGIGRPISYADQRNGMVFHDVFPTRANSTAISSQSSAAALGFHSEMFFHPEPPDFLMLHCLRSDPAGEAVTSVAALEDIESELDGLDRHVLRQSLFAPDLARLHGSYTFDGRPIRDTDPRPTISVVDMIGAKLRLRFEPALTTPLNDLARNALHAAERVAGRVAAVGALRQGGLLLIDNRRAVHSRSDFPASFDGEDRWLRRMMVSANVGDAATVRCCDSLELVADWSAIKADIAQIPYAAETARKGVDS